MIDFPSSLEKITEEAQQFVVAPLAAFGVAGFVFSVEGEQVATLSADITDHYTEDNRALQDHIAIKPDRITLKGYVGELIYNGSGQSPTLLQSVAQKLTEISSFLPALTAGAETVQEAITSPTDLSLSSASDIYATIKNVLGAFGDTSTQQNAYTYFKSLMKSATLMGVQTPWEFMSNMAIETVTSLQPEETKYVTDFAITLKKIRIAQVTSTAYSTGGTGGTASPSGPALQGAAADQGAPTVNTGVQPGTTLPTGVAGPQGIITAVSGIASNLGLSTLFRVLP